jgi:hypothetical protein
MHDHHQHANHDHVHGKGCGHTAIQHGDHIDYLHDGHQHRAHDGHTDECAIGIDAANPIACTPSHACAAHATDHIHGKDCGHEAVPHGDHIDYLVGGHLHFPHGAHCDDHGRA